MSKVVFIGGWNIDRRGQQKCRPLEFMSTVVLNTHDSRSKIRV